MEVDLLDVELIDVEGCFVVTSMPVDLLDKELHCMKSQVFRYEYF